MAYQEMNVSITDINTRLTVSSQEVGHHFVPQDGDVSY